jgi:uncharacterized membrane protein YhaH (DUF805 family)
MDSRIDRIVKWRAALALFAGAVVTFVLANVTVTGKSGEKNYPGVVSNVFWFAFLVLALVLILLGLVALFKRLRPRNPSPAA